MKIVQIVGPSFSGSTVLGFVLNTKKGWTFGSEMYRFLKGFRESNGVENNPNKICCTVCGPECSFWSFDLKSGIFDSDTNALSDVYRLVSEYHHDVDVLIDGSKLFRWYKGTSPDARLVTCKHPIRLLASFAYNSRARLGCDSDDLREFGQFLSDNLDEILVQFDQRLISYIEIYKTALSGSISSFLCRTDELHYDDFFHFEELCTYLGCRSSDFSPTKFSEYSVHPVSGNRAPHWQVSRARSVSSKDRARFEYYSEAESVGDLKIDDKHKIIFDASVRNSILSLSSYNSLCKNLGYSFDVK